MDKQLFDDLVESLKQAKAISKDDVKASRRFKVEDTDVKAIRESVALSHQKSQG
jgi:DNA-binding transcriptional regulator YiaG